MAVWDTHTYYQKYAPAWVRARDAICGLDAVKGKGETYLPRLKDQDENEYAAYRNRASWFGASAQVTSGLLGMLFRRPPRAKLPAGIAAMTNDIDMAGTPLDIFAQQCAGEILAVERVGILVDYPSLDLDGKVVTLAEQQTGGLRPTLAMYKTETILNWRHRRVKNAWALSMVVLEEWYEEAVGEFAIKGERRWRVLDLDANDEYRQRIFRKKDQPRNQQDTEEQVGGDVYPMINGSRLNYIPFYGIGVDDLDIEPCDPPLMSLFDINLAHYRVSADYENGCHFVGLPTPYVAGYTPEESEDGTPPPKLFVGSSFAWVFPDPNTKVGYLEFIGSGLSSLKDNLDRKETQMAVVGSRMLAAENKGRSNESATSATVHRIGESSKLSSIAETVSMGLERALEVFAMWANATGDVEYKLNRDFMPVVMDALTIQAMVAALESKTISFETFWDMLQRGDVGDLDITAEQELIRIKAIPEGIGIPPPKGPADATETDPKTKVATGAT